MAQCTLGRRAAGCQTARTAAISRGSTISDTSGAAHHHPHVSLVGQEQFAARQDIVRLAPLPLGRVLDVGCGPGLTGAALREAGAEEVRRAARDPDLARAAATRLDRVIQADLGQDPLLGLAPASVDLLVYADVLEHLLDPWSLLVAQRALLRPGGAALISLPNIRHIRVLGDLLIRGRFTYRAEGIMSIGHLRFFTTRSMRSLITGAGYRISREEANYAPMGGVSSSCRSAFWTIWSPSSACSSRVLPAIPGIAERGAVSAVVVCQERPDR